MSDGIAKESFYQMLAEDSTLTEIQEKAQELSVQGKSFDCIKYIQELLSSVIFLSSLQSDECPNNFIRYRNMVAILSVIASNNNALANLMLIDLQNKGCCIDLDELFFSRNTATSFGEYNQEPPTLTYAQKGQLTPKRLAENKEGEQSVGGNGGIDVRKTVRPVTPFDSNSLSQEKNGGCRCILM